MIKLWNKSKPATVHTIKLTYQRAASERMKLVEWERNLHEGFEMC